MKSGLLFVISLLFLTLLITSLCMPSVSLADSPFIETSVKIPVIASGTSSAGFNKPEPLFRGCNDCSGKPVAPFVVRLEVDPVLSIGEPFLVKAILLSPSDWKDAVLKIETGDNLVLSSGILQWNGAVRANVPVELSVYLSFTASTMSSVFATGGLNLKEGTKLFTAVEKEIFPPGILLKSTSSMKTAIEKTLPGVVEVMGVER
jgi:hypothetical protein